MGNGLTLGTIIVRGIWSLPMPFWAGGVTDNEGANHPQTAFDTSKFWSWGETSAN